MQVIHPKTKTGLVNFRTCICKATAFTRLDLHPTPHVSQELLVGLVKLENKIIKMDVCVCQNYILHWVNTPTLDSCFGLVGHHQQGAECDPLESQPLNIMAYAQPLLVGAS